MTHLILICITTVIDRNLSILVATTQLSEANNSPVLDRESFLIGDSLYRCRSMKEKPKYIDLTYVYTEIVERQLVDTLGR